MGVVNYDFHFSGQVPFANILEKIIESGRHNSKESDFNNAFGMLSDDLLNLFGRIVRNVLTISWSIGNDPNI